ncbi:TIGR03936 family radical SAM-associated protein, partial [Nocardioides hankookensis]
MRAQPEQQAPPVQRLRIRYAKRGRLRFTSHRDFSRAFERAIFRARLPMAYSSGFNPHPRISYAGASPTGAASEAEYVEVGLAEVVDPAVIHAQLDEALPDGLDVLAVVESPGGSLADLLEGSHWLVDVAADPEAAAS